MGGDANAHNGAWGFDEDDVRGEDLLEWSILNGFMVLNDRNLGPTFETTRGQSSVDVTLTKGVEGEEWKILNKETLSGHKYLSYCVRVNFTAG